MRRTNTVAQWVQHMEKRPRKNKCVTCNLPQVAKAVREFAELKDEGKTSLSWSTFHVFLRAKRSYRSTYYALMNHVKHCLAHIKGRYATAAESDPTDDDEGC